MKENSMVLADKLRRPSALAAASLLFAASLVPLLSSQTVNAYGLLGDRQIKMSSSAVGTSPDGIDVQYEVSFEVTSDTQDIAGIVIDFCQNSPIIGDACTAPAGFTLDPANLALATTAGFSVDDVNSTANTLVLTHGTAYNPAALEVLTFTLGDELTPDVGIKNPDATGVFYGRIVTFTTALGAQDYDSTTANVNNPGAEPPVIDAGGVALSTAQQITVTAKVQERLTFCVYTGALVNNDCTPTGNQVTLGDVNGVLDPDVAYTDVNTKYNITTNASGGAIVRAKGDTLRTGGFSIDAIAAGNNTGTTSTPGSEQFGICTYEDTGSLVTGGITPATPYSDALCAGVTTGASATNGATFAFDTTTANDNITSTYGDTIASKTAGGFSTGRVAFLGNISNTTEAGIYTTAMTFVATGTY